jgi:hypothetical protein
MSRDPDVLDGPRREREVRTLALLAAGVRVEDPGTTFVGPLVRVEPGATLRPFVFLEGKTVVRAGAIIGPLLAVGLVVDDAIVVVEAIEAKIEQGLSPHDAAVQAMDEVSGALVAIAGRLLRRFGRSYRRDHRLKRPPKPNVARAPSSLSIIWAVAKFGLNLGRSDAPRTPAPGSWRNAAR